MEEPKIENHLSPISPQSEPPAPPPHSLVQPLSSSGCKSKDAVCLPLPTSHGSIINFDEVFRILSEDMLITSL